MILSNILFPNKFLLLLRNENASLLLYENGKLVLKSIIFGLQYKTEWEGILEQHRDYPIEILIDNGLEFFHELPLSHLNFLDRLRCIYYKRKELKIFNNFIECFVSRSKDQVFATFLTFSKTHKLYSLIEWIDTQKFFFLGVRLFCLELCSFFRKNSQDYSEGNKMFFIRETSEKLRQIVIAENRILLEIDLFIGESKQSIIEKIKQETTTMGTYFSRQNIIIENVIIISNQKISGLESIFKETQTAFSLHEIILKSSHTDIPWFDKIIIQNIGCEPSRFIIKSPTYYRSLINYYINKKFSWICSIFFILILMVGILLYQKKIYDTHRRYLLENEINVLRKTITNFEKKLKFKDIEGVRKSITSYEKISPAIQNPLSLIFELIP